MNINNLFFHIHYCNGRQSNEGWKFSKKIKRALNHHELIFASKGKGVVTIENKKYQIKDGMLFYITPDVMHTIEIDITDPICFFSVHFSYAAVDFNSDKWGVKREVEVFPLQAINELKDYYQIEDTFKKLVETWMGKLPGYEFTSKVLFQQLLIDIHKNIKKKSQDFSSSLKVEKIIKYMHSNINDKVTLRELSDMVQLSPAYLSRIFKEITGYSIIEFFNKMKVDKAKEIIVEGDKKIREISQLFGFNDEFYFSRIFKKYEGISPSEFYNKNVHVD